MLNKSPIFVNGFQRGGTNILMNLIVSHPDICMLGGETHIVFYGRSRGLFQKLIPGLKSLPILVSTKQHTFWLNRFETRKIVPRYIMPYIDFLFYTSKMFAPRNRIRDEETRNSLKDIHRSRLLCKNVNGVTLATPIFNEMYPDATFFGLVRNGLALCEGFVRRGWTAERTGRMYQIVCQQMLGDANRLKNYKLIYFEDMVQSPAETIREIYEFAGLSILQVSKFRLQSKQVMRKEGRRGYVFGGERDRETHWFKLESLENHLSKDVNENQIAQLTQKDKDTFLQYARSSMEQLGYI
jgi:hypothetical protein